MVYLTKSQRDSRALFLALPCRNCGCGIRARDDAFKREMDAKGKDTHYKKTTCDDLKARYCLRPRNLKAPAVPGINSPP